MASTKREDGITEVEERDLHSWDVAEPVDDYIRRALDRKITRGKATRERGGVGVQKHFAGIFLSAGPPDSDAGRLEWLHREAATAARTLQYAKSSEAIETHGASWAIGQAAEAALTLGCLEEHIAVKERQEKNAVRGAKSASVLKRAQDTANKAKADAASKRDSRWISLLRRNGFLPIRPGRRGALKDAAALIRELVEANDPRAADEIEKQIRSRLGVLQREGRLI